MMLLHTVVELLWSRRNATDNELIRGWDSWPVSARLILGRKQKFSAKMVSFVKKLVCFCQHGGFDIKLFCY